MNILRKIDHRIFNRLQNHYARLLEKECRGARSLLDVGCGSNSPVKYFSASIPTVIGVDGFAPSIERSKNARIHHEYHLMNVMDLGKHFPRHSIDVVVASDVIEHLTKEDGFRLIKIMEEIARYKVIIFTPNGFLEQREYDGNKYQVHLSGWEIGEMRKLGYRVTGVNGWRALRGEFGALRYRPKALWERISLISQSFTTRDPTHAFAILCVKDVSQGH